MPVRFLTAEQEHRYGRFAGSPSIEQFARYFHLDGADREFVNAHRQELLRLGCAVQLGTVRFMGTFLSDPTDVPEDVVAVMARQLGIADPSGFPLYRKGRARWLHAAEIRKRYGMRGGAGRPATPVPPPLSGGNHCPIGLAYSSSWTDQRPSSAWRL